jgi:hypothetical protein
VAREIKNPDRELAAGFEALRPYASQDDLWSPSDGLAKLFDDPAIGQRIGEIIARSARRPVKRAKFKD